MPQPHRDQSRDSRKAEVLEVAARLFARHGYHGTSLRDIAREVGVTPGAIYAHFDSKSALLLAVYEAGVAAVAEAVDRAVAKAAGPWERLEAAAAAHLATLTSAGPFARVVIRVLPGDEPAVAAALVALRDGYEARFRALADELALEPGVDRGLLRLFLLGALNWAQTWHSPGGAGPEAVAGQLVRMLRDGARERAGQTR